MVTDPIADLLTRMRNAIKAHKEQTTAPHSKLKVALLEVLKKHGYIAGFEVTEEGVHRTIVIQLTGDKTPQELRRVSKPGQRIYIKKTEIKPVLNGYGISVLSAPKGVMSGDEARKAGLGGELICEIW